MSDALREMHAGAHDGFAARLYALAGLGDIGVGALVLVWPPLLGWLIGQELSAGGEIAARLLGCAAIALGIGWWRGRGRPEARRALHPGLLVYNFGAGAVFVVAAANAAQALIPAIVAALHLALGVAAVRAGTKVQ